MACSDCTAGKYLPATGSDSEDDCVACAKGKYTPSGGLSVCSDCVAGRMRTIYNKIEVLSSAECLLRPGCSMSSIEPIAYAVEFELYA